MDGPRFGQMHGAQLAAAHKIDGRSENACRCAAASRTARRDRAAERRRPSAALRGRYARRAFRRRRLCRPGRPECVIGACQWSGVAITTASIVRSSSMRRKSDSQRGDSAGHVGDGAHGGRPQTFVDVAKGDHFDVGQRRQSGRQHLALIADANRRDADALGRARSAGAASSAVAPARPTMPTATPAAFLALDPKNCRRLTSCFRNSSTFMRLPRRVKQNLSALILLRTPGTRNAAVY